MKKVSRIIIAVILALAFIGSSLAMIFANLNSYYIHIKKTLITKSVGDSFYVKQECDISTYAGDENTEPYFTSSNQNILYVNSASGYVYCYAEGEAKIYVYLNTDRGTLQKEIKVNVTKKITYPTYANLPENSVILTDSITSIENKVDTDGKNMRVDISYENNIVEYNFETGMVTSKGEYGNDRVNVKIYKQDGTYFDLGFDVEVIEVNEITHNVQAHLSEQSIALEYASDNIQGGNDFGAPVIEDETILEFLPESSSFGLIYVKPLKLGTTTITVTNGVTRVVFTVEVIE